MNINELYRITNIMAVERYDEPITGEEFVVILATLVVRGILVQVDDDVFFKEEEICNIT